MTEHQYGSQSFEEDLVSTRGGDLVITCIGHGTLMMRYDGLVIHIDPVGAEADYDDLPKADLIILTHHHQDHLDLPIIEGLKKPDTDVVLTEICARQVSGGIVMTNGDTRTVRGVGIEALPAYNIQHTRPDGVAFHVKGEGNGYLLTFGDKRVLVAGDTEDTPEIRALEDIDIAFLPMNLPYTMTPEQVAQAAMAFRPGVVYPYHYGSTDTSALVDLLGGSGTEVRIRRLA